MTREQGLRELVATILSLAKEHPVSGKLETLVRRELEQAPFRLGRNFHVTSLEQAVSILRTLKVHPHLTSAGRFHAIVGLALILGGASTAGKGNAAYGILYRMFRNAVNAFDRELSDGRAPTTEAPAA